MCGVFVEERSKGECPRCEWLYASAWFCVHGAYRGGEDIASSRGGGEPKVQGKGEEPANQLKFCT